MDTRDHPTLITRAEARQSRQGKYYTGRPCPHGHYAQRWTASGACVECARIDKRKRYESDKDRYAAYGREWRGRNPQKLAEYEARRDPEKSRFYAREWHRRNPDRSREGRLRYILAHPEKPAEWQRRRYAAKREIIRKQRSEYDVTHRDKVLEWSAISRAKRHSNPDVLRRYRDQQHDCYQTNVEHYRQYQRRYRVLNRDKIRSWSLARLARKKNAAGRGITAEDIAQMRKEQDGICAYCGGDDRLTVDHVKALDRGGEHDARNALMACLSCNSGKRHHVLKEFLDRLTRRRATIGLKTATLDDIRAVLARAWRH